MMAVINKNMGNCSGSGAFWADIHPQNAFADCFSDGYQPKAPRILNNYCRGRMAIMKETDMRCAGTSDGKTTLLEWLRNHGYYINADCGGRGSCGKCKVHFLLNAPEPSEAESAFLTSEEISRSIRLACEARPIDEFEIEWEYTDEQIEVEAGGLKEEGLRSNPDHPYQKAIAVDIGTTTIAAALLNCSARQVVNVRTGINHQRIFGSDVISRIQASTQGKGPELMNIIREDLKKLVSEMGEDIEKLPVAITGNTTMQHLFLGFDCSGLGVFPFTPVDISLHQAGNYLMLPGISTYVGSDITAGIVSCGMDQSKDICALIDIGTNGEMALGNKDMMLVTSTAAGPAFEGGNISCGVAGIPGAICQVEITSGNAGITTIQNQPPVGLCGTGVLEIMYELLKEEIVDETGLMEDEYDGSFPICQGISFSDKDIREVQLAKSAVRSGLDTLIHEYGISYNDISKLYLAGGFGQKINLEKAAGIGLLPKELISKAEAVGNSSLSGAIMACFDKNAAERFCRVVRISREVSLSESKIFQQLFIDNMFFE